jgi:signal transduction histidine kinase
VALLRTPDRLSRNTASLSNIESVIDLGPDVEFTTDIRVPDALPGVVDATAFRIIQESVTNIVKHSDATRVRIEASCQNDEFYVSIVNNGRRAEPGTAAASGHGINGMRERTTALGGTLETGPMGDGFAVRARIPLGGRP